MAKVMCLEGGGGRGEDCVHNSGMWFCDGIEGGKGNKRNWLVGES